MHQEARHFESTEAAGRPTRPTRARSLLVVGSAFLFAMPLALFEPAAHWAREPELFQLLRGMAVIKAALAVLALAAVWWRLGKTPTPGAFVAPYAVGVLAMALATGLIWQLTAIVAASVLFHSGTITLLVAAWRDVEPRSARHLGKDHGQRPAERDRAGQRTDQRVAGLAIHPAADQAVDQEIRDDHHSDDQQEEQIFERQRYG